MISTTDTPDEAYWVEVDGNRRVHPYGMYEMVNMNTVEVSSVISGENGSPKRWVLVRDGTHEVWVKVAEREQYGYSLQPDERVSDAEREAITLKQAALRQGSSVSVDEARAVVESGDPEQIQHALVALYHAAKADPDVSDSAVDELREFVHERTGHVDTDHIPTLRRILDDAGVT